MKISDFETFVQRKKMRIERREKYKEREIYVCEGYSRGDSDEPAPHYKTMFAIALDPYKIMLGEFFATPILFPIKTKESRLSEAVERAKEFFDGMNADAPS